MPEIVLLDGYTMNPGDISWSELEKLGSCKIYERTPPELTVERIGNAEIILVNKVVITREIMEQSPKLKYIGVLATGYNVVDVNAAKEHDIVVTNVPGYADNSVAQAVFAHLLNLVQRTAHHAQTVRNGQWSSCPDFCYWDYPQIELAGLTLGIVGCGRIGRRVAEIARVFGMEVIGYSPSTGKERGGVEMIELEELFKRADVVSLHCQLTRDNEKMVNSKMLSLMKPTAFLINTSRGKLIDEFALAAALKSGVIAGSGLDVLSDEPPSRDNPLVKIENCFITPHIAWASVSARQRLCDVAVANIKAFFYGCPQNIVS